MGVVGRFSRSLRNRDVPSLPLPAGPVSNGEFIPAAPDAAARATNELIRSTVDAAARHVGMDRRRFLQSAGAVAASLAAFELAGLRRPGTVGPGFEDPPRSSGGTFRFAPPPTWPPATRPWPPPVSSCSMSIPTTWFRPDPGPRMRPRRSTSSSECSPPGAPTALGSTASTVPPISTTCSWPATRP